MVAESEWEYEGRPITNIPRDESWAWRSIPDCEELIAEHANPDHNVHAPHNADMGYVIGYVTRKRIKAGPWIEDK